VKESSPKKIRILIVDDSMVSQKLYRHIIAADDRFEVVCVASNGQDAIDCVKKYSPDVVSMDINMPKMNGIEATRLIMQQNPVPIVISSSLYDPTQQEMAMQVLEAGAVAIMPKPFGPGHPGYNSTSRQWLRMLKSMSEVKVIRRKPFNKSSDNQPNFPESSTSNFGQKYPTGNYKVLVIGASAGGPESVKAILSQLDKSFPLPVLLVQHIDRHFSEGYRLWLQSYTNIPVLTATDNQPLKPAHVYLSPGDKHLVLKSEGMATLSNDLPARGHKPSVAHLFKSAAEIYGANTIAVILSGMGNDGAAELKLLRNLGALTFAQNEASCLVFGMPGEAVKMDAAVKVLPPDEIVKQIMNLF